MTYLLGQKLGNFLILMQIRVTVYHITRYKMYIINMKKIGQKVYLKDEKMGIF